MADSPSGTVTFLVTDIEGSTRLAQQFPAALPAALARHHAILRQAIDSSHGYVFRVMGDAFCVAFSTAIDALAAARARSRRSGPKTGARLPSGSAWACTQARPIRGTAITMATSR